MKQKTLKLLCLVLILGLILSFVYSEEQKRILMISSYSPSFMTFFNQIDGVKAILNDPNMILDIEFMDSKRLYTEENLNNFYESLKYKMSELPTYDVVITTDDNALNFVLEHQEELFPNTPIIFCGVNNIDNAEKASLDPYITGVIEASSIDKTIEIGLELNPEADKVIAITDNTNSGQGDLVRFYALEDKFEQLNFLDVDLTDYTFETFGEQLETIDDSYIVLLLSVYSDKANNRINFYEGLDLVTEHCDQPIYHPYYHGIGDGVLGGKVISHFEQGKSAAEMVLKVLNGESVSNIQLMKNSPNRYVFDYPLMEEYGIEINQLPNDVELLNYTETFLEKYGNYILMVTLLVIVEFGIIMVLIRTVNHKKRIEKELLKNHEVLKISNDEISILNQTLETRVVERTSELDATMQELTATLESLENAQERLIKNKTMESFLNLSRKISHQINTPLGVSLTSSTYIHKIINELSQKLEQKNISKKEFDNALIDADNNISMITNNLTRAISVIDELQKFSVFEPKKTIRVKESLQVLVDDITGEEQHSGVKIDILVDERLVVKIQEMLFLKIILSLIKNALDFNPHEGLEISVEVATTDHVLTIMITDNGKGIDEQISDKILEPFFSTSPHKIGMGLFIVENIVFHTFDGKFYLDKTFKAGTRFVIEFEL